ncbi:MAG: MFS transporter, partial [Xanthomonadaceae bacterium]|nr:MFS transporter [Xanthomonadaceae bacterium]
MKAVGSISSLLLGVAIILAGNGLVGTLLGVRGQLEGLSEAVIGAIMAGYFGGFVIGTYWVPKLIRRIGHIRAFASLASIASVATLLHGLYLQPGLWFGLRVVSGFCIVGLYIAIESWLNEQTSNEQRGHVFSAYMTTTLIGLGIGQVLLMTGDARQLELFALASVLLSLGLVPVAMTTVREPLIVESARLGLRKLYAISPLGVVGCIFSGAGTGAFWALGPVFASAIGLDTGGIAAFMSLVIAGGILMLWPVGKMSDRFDRRKILAWTCVLTSVSALATALMVAVNPLWVMVGGFCYGAFGFSIFSLAAAHTNDHLDPSHMLEVTSTLQLLWSIGAIAAPIAAGLLMHAAGPEALLFFISVTALAPALFAGYRMRVSDAIPLSEQGEFVVQFVTSPAALEMHPDAETETTLA